nr:hypothetical protein GCM10017611_00440 [Rhodococcus wratislaviensis]
MRARGLLPPGFFSRQGMAVVRAILRRALIVKGVIAHPITVLRLIALMSVKERRRGPSYAHARATR